MKRIFIEWVLVISLICATLGGITSCNANLKRARNQDIAEFAAYYEHKYDDCEEMVVKIIDESYDEMYGGAVITCVIYEDGRLKYHETFNKEYYENLIKRYRENS